jgi:phenylalanyl-tRNA synthetase alpha chain
MKDENDVSWSTTQHQRIRQLGGGDELLQRRFQDIQEKEKTYQDIEKSLVKSARADFGALFKTGGKTRLEILCDRVSESLVAEGFVKVTTPTVISAKALEKMTITENHPLYTQVFWLNKKQCLRPMLAPNLYSLMQDFTRLKHRPLRFFEIGSCFRKETDGAKHSSEFTMLNLVEMGGATEHREARLKELGSLVVQSAGLTSFTFETEESEVYGTTIDIVSGTNEVEIASGAIGPHPLDHEWGVHDNWVGFGIGMERLLMLLQNDTSIARWSKSISYLDGICLKL